MGEAASTLFHRLVKGNNVMTPYSVAYGYCGEYVYEISEGRGFVNEPMFGVTFVDRETGELNREMGQLLDNMQAALEWVDTWK